MSIPHQYHQPNAPDPVDDDSDSDLDLELQELNPEDAVESRSAASYALQHTRDEQPAVRGFATHIPLRNLRAGKTRRQKLGSQDGLIFDAEDHEMELHDAGEDGLPLLPITTNRRRRRPPENALGKIGSSLRLPSFGMGSRRSSLPAEVSVEEEAEEEHDPSSDRTVLVGQKQPTRFPQNAVSNAKYEPWSFLPITLYNEFKFFLNTYFLLVALSQIIPQLRIGYLSTYIAPLAFVLAITLGKEAWDDIARRKRDAEANSEPYTILRFDENPSVMIDKGKNRSTQANARTYAEVPGERETCVANGAAKVPGCQIQEQMKASKDLKIGDVLRLTKNQRVPADVVILKSVSVEQTSGYSIARKEESSPQEPPGLVEAAQPAPQPPLADDARDGQETELNGEAFIRTDQLDGETDWKLRIASPLSQSLQLHELNRIRVIAGKPDRKVNEFVGTIEFAPAGRPYDEPGQVESSQQTAPLSIDHTAWCNTVLASSSTVYAVVVYTGSQTRQALSTSASRTKVGLLELEINSLTKILCVLTLSLSCLLVLLGGLERENKRWYISVMRYLILFSTVVPISLRVNLDMAKTVYAWFIEHDKGIPGTVVRTSTIPEDLGRVEYLLTDKTGTLTQNEMELKKIHVGTVSYANEAMDEVSSYINQALTSQTSPGSSATSALVTPSTAYVAAGTSSTRTRREIGARVRDLVLALAICHNVTPTTEEVDGVTVTTYQASSPDEIAIVRWTESVGLRLAHRDRGGMILESCYTGRIVAKIRILNLFPFTSDSKRMGIVVRFDAGSASSDDSEIWFYQKGADTVMTSIVAANDWLDEETANMAREGLRTLVVGRKRISTSQYQEFSNRYAQAALALGGRDAAMAAVVKEYLERDVELLGVTGVEDKLQRDVKPSLELLRNAGVKIWMLTGDKVETARCVAVSSKLVARGQYIHTVAKLKRKDLANDSLDFLRGKHDACLLIDGESLALMLRHYRDAFITVAVRLPAVVACRCSPTQKAEIAKLIRSYTKKRICCIGDGGNDVSMIQAADVGVGIVGKEGRQASLAADFSIEQFCYLTKLLVWHGRNSYKRSAKLAQFVIHRGLIISVCQAIFSIASKFEPNALYRDWLLVGYATIYTLAPVFSLVLDCDVDESLANLYPELYKELTTGRSLSYKTFFVWVAVSIYQGSVIQGLSQLLLPPPNSPSTSTSASASLDNNNNSTSTSSGYDANFPRVVAVSYTALVLNELLMVAASVTTWHPAMIGSILATAAVYFGSVPFLGGYFDLRFVATLGFVWRCAVVLAMALVPFWAGKLIRRSIRPPNYRKVRGV